jgi:uncharacterized RDD family membrane protein YckC
MRDSMAMSDAAVGLNLAGVGTRFVALLIDVVILSVVGGVLSAIFGESPTEAGAGSSLINTVLSAAFFIGLISQWGTTLGGRIMGIKVVDAGGQPLSVGASAIRWVMSLVSGAVILLGYLWAFWDGKKQTWHDKVAGSFVVKA